MTETLRTCRHILPVMLAVAVLMFCTQCKGNADIAANSSAAPSVSSGASQSTSSEEKVTEETNKVTLDQTYLDEIDRIRDSLVTAQTPDGFSFIMLTDTHIDYTGGAQPERQVVEKEIAAIVELANTTNIDCVILGGDLIHGTSSYDSSLNDLKYFAKTLSECKVPVYVNRGNHDANDYHGKPCAAYHIIDQTTWTDTILDPLARNTAVHDPDNEKSTYYYVDFDSKKTRLIVLDPFNYPVVASDGLNCDWTAETWTGIEDKQLDWLASVAISAEKQGWNYVISAHAPLTGSETFKGSYKVIDIVSALNNGGTYTLSDKTVIDYSDYTSYAPLSVSGHTHVNSYNHNDKAKIFGIGTGSGKVSYYPNQAGYYADVFISDWVFHPERTFGNITEATFDVITLSDDGTVIRLAFGAGEDNGIDIPEYVKK